MDKILTMCGCQSKKKTSFRREVVLDNKLTWWQKCFGTRNEIYGTISLTEVTEQARAGDIILLQEAVLFDYYTRLNSQVNHLVKQLFRLKIDY